LFTSLIVVSVFEYGLLNGSDKLNATHIGNKVIDILNMLGGGETVLKIS